MDKIQPVLEGALPRPAGRGGASSRETAAPPVGPVPAAAPPPAIDPDNAREMARQVQEALERVVPAPHEIAFRRDETTNGFVIEVRNPDGSLVRQYPPEKLLNLRRKLDEMSGMVIDEMT
ncbi:flagellar protein FlaG [bacterium]|nr:flagellar protein FlaG [bacterium]